MQILHKLRKQKIATKVALYLSLGLFIMLSLLTFVITTSTAKDLSNREVEKLTLLAQKNAQIASRFMESLVARQEVLADNVLNVSLLEPQNRIPFLEKIVADLNNRDVNSLTSFLIMEPNALFPDKPNGFSIFDSASGTTMSSDRFANIDQTRYEEALKKKNLVIVDPFQKTIDGKEYMTIAILVPVIDGSGKVIGMAGSNVDCNLLNSEGYDNGGYTSFTNQIICAHQTVIINSQHPEYVGKKFIDVTTSKTPEVLLNSMTSNEPLDLLDENKDGSKSYRSSIPFNIGSSTSAWLSEAGISEDEFNKSIINQIILIGIFSLIALLVLDFLFYFIVRALLKPISEFEYAAKQLSEGRLDTPIHYTSYDELGSLADSLRSSFQTISLYITDIDCAMQEMSGGNFDVAPSQPFIGDFKNIELSITNMILTMSKTLDSLKQVSYTLSAGSEQVSTSSQLLSQGAAEQSSAVELLNEMVGVISEQIKMNSANTIEVSKKVQVVGGALQESNSQMAQMVIAMAKINEHSKDIGKIIKTIEDIAFQTNILALNASVEAARAGAAGKGFAVVADEVRNLASKSAEAAKNTNRLISASFSAVQEGTRIADATALSLSSVVGGARQIEETVNQISSATAEQADAVTRIVSSVNQIAEVVQTASATAEESAAASEELSGQAQTLMALIRQFKVKDIHTMDASKSELFQ